MRQNKMQGIKNSSNTRNQYAHINISVVKKHGWEYTCEKQFFNFLAKSSKIFIKFLAKI